MDLITELTVKNLTPPGYFNLSDNALQPTKNYAEWWNNILSLRANEATNLKTLLLSPWLYDHPNYPRTPWLQYLLNQYGFGSYLGTNNQAAYLYRLVSGAWDRSFLSNLLRVFELASLPPFSAFTLVSGGISVGNLVSSIIDNGFIIFSTASSPATPSATVYTARDWTVPATWTDEPSEAVSYSRGYISGLNIVWCAPRPVSDFSNDYYFSAAVPVAVASEGTIVIVNDDSTGDIGSVYYSDGTAWRKSSYVNADLGLVTLGGARPDPEAITAWSPDPESITYEISSDIPPVADGNTEGHGTFATFANNSSYTGTLTILLNQNYGGDEARAVLIEGLRRIKPLNKSFLLYIDDVEYTVNDARSA